MAEKGGKPTEARTPAKAKKPREPKRIKDSAVLGRVQGAHTLSTAPESMAAELTVAGELAKQGEKSKARSILRRLYAELPGEQLVDLLPTSQLHCPDSGAPTHVGILEQLASIGGDDGQPETDVLAELARLQPLVPRRLGAVADVAAPSLKRRAQTSLATLLSGGLDSGPPQTELPPPAKHSLADRLISEVLRHPLSRKGTVMGRVQGMIGAPGTPDLRVIRDYCEPLVTASAVASEALAQATFMLGAEPLPGHVSRGSKDVGLRAYLGDPSFLLVGGRHLDDGDQYHLSPVELLFAIGAEVAHLRYDHARVTSSELRQRARDLSKQGLGVVLGLLPLLDAFKAAKPASPILKHLSTDKVVTALSALSQVGGGAQAPSSESESPGLGAAVEELVAAHRVMQLTADRAGLLISGSLPASIRAMLKMNPDYRPLLDRADETTLENALAEKDEHGHLRHQAPAIRVASLIAFYVSEDYALLERELGRPSPGTATRP